MPAPTPGTVIGGKYRLTKELARGGMGSVWVASHTELDTSVAVKLISPELIASDAAIARFRQEARASAQLRSPHVVQILDYGVDAGAPFMVLELLNGEDLAELLDRAGRLSLSRTLEILAPVCKALKLAHDALIVHRDLKPPNIFIARSGDDEVVKIVDFGIAKAIAPTSGLAQTTSAALVGSPIYMSPEQSRGDGLDARTDLWSLGVVTFEMLTGAPPFNGRGLGDVFAQICHGKTPRPSDHGVIAEGLDTFFETALAKETRDRFPTARAFLEAFEKVVQACPTRDRPSPLLRSANRLAPVSDPGKPSLIVDTVAAAPADYSEPSIRSENVQETRDLAISDVHTNPDVPSKRRWLPWVASAVVVSVAAGTVVFRSQTGQGTSGAEATPAPTGDALPGAVSANNVVVSTAEVAPSASASSTTTASSSAPLPSAKRLPVATPVQTSRPRVPEDNIFAPQPKKR
jgi:eukaryotic-like serine/threonine-protein kinase